MKGLEIRHHKEQPIRTAEQDAFLLMFPTVNKSSFTSKECFWMLFAKSLSQEVPQSNIPLVNL